jgi:hypothetical protein
MNPSQGEESRCHERARPKNEPDDGEIKTYQAGDATKHETEKSLSFRAWRNPTTVVVHVETASEGEETVEAPALPKIDEVRENVLAVTKGEHPRTATSQSRAKHEDG